MAEGDCNFCGGGHFKNPVVHKRFCKKNPENIKDSEESGPLEEEILEPPMGELEPEDIQEPEEPPPRSYV